MRAITSPTIQRLAALLAAAVLSGCGQVWNDPYPAAERGGNILYTAFSQRPKHLDPVQSYSEDEATFLYQIYEPPLQYHYLKRPFQLQAAAAAQMPTLRQFDAAGKLLPAGTDPAKIARSEYEIRIRPGIRYQPHPAFGQHGTRSLARRGAGTAAVPWRVNGTDAHQGRPPRRVKTWISWVSGTRIDSLPRLLKAVWAQIKANPLNLIFPVPAAAQVIKSMKNGDGKS